MQRSFRHHYVPGWYQRRFMLENQKSYFRLDLSPSVVTIPSGKKIKKGEVLHKGPTKFFFEPNLYTTRYLDIENDDIEKFLFGKIDTIGAPAIAAMASPNWMREIHPHIQNFYEYMDAQRIRTPKGLTWLAGLMGSRNKNELLLVMQEVRRMHCVTWAEASMEVLSANQSDVKFIVSDNPVSFYNSAIYPGTKDCAYPSDPDIHLKGTRTLFPLDLNHCVVLTNLEYARKPGKFKATKPRTNARYFDSTIIKYDDIIRERELKEQQVLGINYILKNRARKYIAAAHRNWLFPERYLKKKTGEGWTEYLSRKVQNFMELVVRFSLAEKMAN